MVSWPREEVLAACKKYAPLLPPIGDVDPALLLAALAQNESSLGMDCGPKHEDEWDVGGKYGEETSQAKLLAMFPYAAACSYGPFQIMFYNCNGYTPTELNTDLSIATRAAIGFLVRQVRRFDLTTVQQVGEMWNWGHPSKPGEFKRDPAGVQLYCRDLQGNYIAASTWMEGIA